jgi:hypothetical protein
VIASDRRFAYFGTSAFAIRLLRLDQKIGSGMPLNTDATLFREFCDRLSKYGDKTVTPFRGRAGGRGAGFLRPPGIFA